MNFNDDYHKYEMQLNAFKQLIWILINVIRAYQKQKQRQKAYSGAGVVGLNWQ